jgi:hypothetical protein
VLPPKQSGVLECHHISYFEKMKIMSHVFWQISSSIKFQPEKNPTGKKGTVLVFLPMFSNVTIFHTLKHENYEISIYSHLTRNEK